MQVQTQCSGFNAHTYCEKIQDGLFVLNE